MKHKHWIKSLAAAAFCCVYLVIFATAGQGQDAAAAKKDKPFPGDPYPLQACPVSGQKLGSMGKPIVLDSGGREVRLCCKGCKAKFEKSRDEYLKKIDAKIVAQQKKDYPLETCVVLTKSKLGAMGKPVDQVVRNRLVRLCCKACVKQVQSNPAKYFKVLDEAVVAKQKGRYPLKTCVVSGRELSDKPVDYVQGTQLVRLCCKGCVRQVREAPLKHLAKIEEAKKGGTER